MDDAKKKWLFVPVVLAALGVPYAMFDGGLGKLIGKTDTSGSTSDVPFDPLTAHLTGDATAQAWPNGAIPTTNIGAQAAHKLEGPTVQDLYEVIRFDISPRWISERWSRVSTVTADLDLEGVRVPLVTGPRADDLAGSLTYYFDKRHTVQRVTFHGTTGDERRLVTTLCSVYGFREQPSVGGSLFVVMNSGKPISVMRTTHAPVVRANLPNAQREVMLEINRPDTFAGLSPEMRQVLEHDAHIRRW